MLFILGLFGQSVPPPPEITYTLRNPSSGESRMITLPGVVVTVHRYAGFTESNSYLVGGISGAVGALAWQLTGRKNP
jgi:hypothetical protein